VGKISWQDNFDQNVTGSIEYQGLPLEEIDRVQAAYITGNDLTLYGILFSIVKFSYTRQLCDLDVYEIDLYTATITLEGKEFLIDSAGRDRAEAFGFISYADRKAVSLVSSMSDLTVYAGPNAALVLSQNKLFTQKAFQIQTLEDRIAAAKDAAATAGSWIAAVGYQTQIRKLQATLNSIELVTVSPSQGTAFTRYQVIADGGNEVVWNKDGFNATTVTGSFGGNQIQNAGDPSPVTFRLQEPVVETIREYSKDYNRPPENTYVLRDDTSQCFDDKGQKKVWKETIRVNGQPDTEIVRTYGFAYKWEDIFVLPAIDRTNLYYDGEMARFWVQTEERRTQYIYQQAGSTQLSINITDVGNQWVRVAMDPDYNQFASFGGGIITFQSRAQFLVEVETSGWQLMRLKKEDSSHNTVGALKDPYYAAMQFRKVPLLSKTVYLLDSPLAATGEKVSPPFSIGYSDYDSLAPRLKKLFDPFTLTNNKQVAIITPEINYVETLYVKAEGSASNSFTWDWDPENPSANPDQHIAGTNTPLPPPRLMSGEETWNETRRTIIDSSQYSEMVTSYSSQDPGFDNVIEGIVFKECVGSPPTPTSRMFQYTQVPAQAGGGAQQNFSYTLNTPNAGLVDPGGSASYPGAQTVEEARLAAEVDLRKKSMQASRAQKTIFGFYPNLRCGQAIVTEKDRFSNLGQWRAVTIQWTLDYKGIVEPFGLLVTTAGTQVSLGLDRLNPVSISSSPNGATNSPSSPTATVKPSRVAGELGDILPPLQTRRNY
jgi:hypothetical protein